MFLQFINQLVSKFKGAALPFLDEVIRTNKKVDFKSSRSQLSTETPYPHHPHPCLFHLMLLQLFLPLVQSIFTVLNREIDPADTNLLAELNEVRGDESKLKWLR